MNNPFLNELGTAWLMVGMLIFYIVIVMPIAVLEYIWIKLSRNKKLETINEMNEEFTN